MTSLALTIASLSDTGLKRANNEDSIAVVPEKGIAILADGMGGYLAGEIASAIAVTTTQEHIETAMEKGLERKQAQPIEVLLSNAVEMANHAIYTAAQSNPQYTNMGTTLVALVLYNNTIYFAHVGDSRLYRLQDKKLQQLTEDHSLVNELLAQGFYTKEEAAVATNKNIITRAMGVKPEVEADVDSELAHAGDTFLLCSDGLSDLVNDDEIAEILNKRKSNQHGCQQLIDLANERGGKDNISVIIAEVINVTEPSKSAVSDVVGWLFKH